MLTSKPVDQVSLTRAQEMLLEFLRECEQGDTPPDCPACCYSLRNLTKPVCPECGLELMLTVGAARHPIGWLLVSLAPGFFSGIAAFFLSIPIMARVLIGDGVLEPVLAALDAFGWCSGAFAVILAMKRHRFLALPRKKQRRWAIVIWLVHITAFVAFLLTAYVVL